MYILCKNTFNSNQLYKQALSLAKRMYDIEHRLDPWCETYMDMPKPEQLAEDIVDEVNSNRTDVTLDTLVSYGIREYLKDLKSNDWESIANDNPAWGKAVQDYEELYNDLLKLRGIK